MTEWQWLLSFSITLKASASLLNRDPFPAAFKYLAHNSVDQLHEEAFVSPCTAKYCHLESFALRGQILVNAFLIDVLLSDSKSLIWSFLLDPSHQYLWH